MYPLIFICRAVIAVGGFWQIISYSVLTERQKCESLHKQSLVLQANKKNLQRVQNNLTKLSKYGIILVDKQDATLKVLFAKAIWDSAQRTMWLFAYHFLQGGRQKWFLPQGE